MANEAAWRASGVCMCVCVCVRVLSGVKFLGGTYTSVCMYVYTHMRGATWCKHNVVYSILKTTLMHAACISGFLSE